MSLAGFIARRRAGLRAEAEAEARTSGRTDAAEPDTAVEAVAPEVDLPDPDSLVAGDDFAAFMGRAVSSQLRTRALRKLWRTNPVLACVDGLNDYDDDYRAMAAGQGPIKTTYEVGRGLKRHVERLAQIDAEAQADARTEGEAATAPDAVPALAPDPASAPDPNPAPPAATGRDDRLADGSDWPASVPQDETEEFPRTAPRRMRFARPEGVA